MRWNSFSFLRVRVSLIGDGMPLVPTDVIMLVGSITSLFHGLYVQFVMVLQQVPALRRFKRLYLINLPVILYESLIAL